MLRFSGFLAALERRGQTAKAIEYRAKVTGAFRGVLSEREVLALPLGEVLEFFGTFNSIVADSMREDSLGKHVRNLERQGYHVIRGKNWRG